MERNPLVLFLFLSWSKQLVDMVALDAGWGSGSVPSAHHPSRLHHLLLATPQGMLLVFFIRFYIFLHSFLLFLLLLALFEL